MPADKQACGVETDTELLRQGLSFLHQARNTRGLDSSQVARIERRLRERKVRARRTVLWPSLAALAFVLAAGATLAVAERGLRQVLIEHCRLDLVQDAKAIEQIEECYGKR